MSTATIETSTSHPGNWTNKHTAGCILTVGLIVLVGIAGAPIGISWLLFLLLMGVFTGITADGITDSKRGILIDDRNRVSLSRLQMVLWTLLILSAFLAAAISNVHAGAAQPLSIAIPEAIWMLMGISTTTLVGSPLILSTKRSQAPAASSHSTPPVAPAPAAEETGPPPPSPAPPVSGRRPLPLSFASVLKSQGEDPARMAVEGTVVIKHSQSDASWADLFKGDELADVATLDLSKIQMFFFTLVLVLSYAIALESKFRAVDAARAQGQTVTVLVAPRTAPGVKAAIPNPTLVDEFPPLDMGFVTLLGISHAGFLVNGAIPRNQPAT